MRRRVLRLALLLAAVLVAHFTLRATREDSEQRVDDAVAAITATKTAEPPAVAASPATRAERPSTTRIRPCAVTHVADGDTLNVRCGARKERVRMLQVDTPEREQPLYAEAGRALEKLIAGRPVELELGAEERDDYGRLLAYVFADGENLNVAMVRDGWSPYFDRYGAGAYPREFAEAERAARERGLGIWSAAR